MVAAGLTVFGSPLPFCLASWVKTVVVNLGRYAGYEVWNWQRQMTVISGLPSLVSANNRTESRASAAVTLSGCWRSTAREKPASSPSRVDPAGTGAVSPGDSGLFSRPSTPPSTSVRAGEGHTARSAAGTLRVTQSAAAAARPYSGPGPLLARPKARVKPKVPVM